MQYKRKETQKLFVTFFQLKTHVRIGLKRKCKIDRKRSEEKNKMEIK